VVTALVIPTLGGSHLAHCLDAVAELDPAPSQVVVIASGGENGPVVPSEVELVVSERRLGFAEAANTGFASIASSCDRMALLNDDAVPAPDWLEPLERALDANAALSAVQGTVTDAVGATVDGRGITLDRFGLPIQVDRGATPAPEAADAKPVLAVSGTASLFRTTALSEASLADGAIFDPVFGSYHEDLDLGLRLRRLGWSAAWVPGAWTSHVGSATSRRHGWRHPWWVLTNRWRALAGNLTAGALAAALPRLLRGELRALRTLARGNARVLVAALPALGYLPFLAVHGLRRPSAGPRLTALPEAGS